MAAATHLLFTRTTCHCHPEEDHSDDDEDNHNYNDDDDNDEGYDEKDHNDEDNYEDNGEDDHSPIWMRMTFFILTCFRKEADCLLIQAIWPAGHIKLKDNMGGSQTSNHGNTLSNTYLKDVNCHECTFMIDSDSLNIEFNNLLNRITMISFKLNIIV